MKLFVSKRKEVAGGWRKLYSEELHDTQFSSNFIILMKLRRIMLAGLSEFWCGIHKERDHLEYVSVDRRIILNRLLKK
jgi:hypothetical protein